MNLRNHPIQKDITDQELEHQMAEKWEQLPVEKRERPVRFKEYVAPGRSNHPDEPEIVDDPQQVELSNDAQRFLKDVVENPFKPLTQRYEKFSSRYKGNKAKNELLENGVVIERTVSTGEGRLKLLEFTDKGRTYLEDQDIGIDREGRGGVVHRYWQHQVQEIFEEAGWTAQIEVFDADVYVHMDEVELAIEIAMGPNDREIEHVEKHLSKDFEVWIVCRNPEVKTKLQSKLNDKAVDENCVQTMLVHDLVDIDPDNTADN